VAILTRDPFLIEPFRMADQIFGRMFGTVRQTTGWVPALDVRELDDEYLVLVDLPGVKSEDVSIELQEQTLTISGTRVPYEAGESTLVERPYGAFTRMLTVPQGIDAESIWADFAHGVLTLHVPKPEHAKPKKIAIGSGAERKAIGTSS
jgi:HSP20 family protein